MGSIAEYLSEDVGAIGVTRGDDPAAFRNEPMHAP
jgi:hypothetical protein